MNVFENNSVKLQEITPGDPYPVYDPPAEPLPEPTPEPIPNPDPPSPNPEPLVTSVLVVLKFLPALLSSNKFKNLNLDQVDVMPGKTFEHYVAELLTYRGFKTEVTRGSGDFGVDIVAQNGNTRYAVQCKRYSKNISRTAVSDAVAGVKSYNCQVPIVVTNRYFTKGAKELAHVNRCILIDRDILAEWINDYREKKPVHKLLK